MTIDKTLDHSLQLIAENAAAMERHRAAAESILDGITKDLVGRRVEYGLGNLKGQYEITDVDLAYDGEIRARGRKVTTAGRLGSQRWDIGRITAKRLGL